MAPEPISPRLWATGVITGAAAFMAMLDSTVVNLAVDAIGRDLGAGLSTVQWVMTAYLGAMAVSLPAAGWAGRRFGNGRVWVGAVTTFVAASLLCALAPGPDLLIFGRCVQGLGAGLMVPAGQAVLGTAANPRQLGRLMGTVGFAVALGPALGPAIGGWLLEMASWRWLFWLNIPFGLAALLAAGRIVRGGEKDSRERLDMPGFASLGLGLPLLLYGAAGLAAGQRGAMPVASIAAGVVLALGYALRAHRAPAPLLALDLFRDPVFSLSAFAAALCGANMYAGLLVLPLFLLRDVGQDVATVGLMLMLMGIGSAATLPIAGALTDRFGPGRTIFVGSGLLALATAALFVPTTYAPASLASLLTLRGIGLALAQMPAVTAAYGIVRNKEMSDAATLVNLVQRLAAALGASAAALGFELYGFGPPLAGLLALAIATGLTAMLLHRPRA